MRTSPICTNSAAIPATFIPLMRPTSAAGDVFSIPKRTPIFFTFSTLSQSWEVSSGHRPPVRPIVFRVVPDVQGVGDPLGVEQRRELFVGGAADVVIAGDQDPFVAPELIEVIRVGQVRQERRRGQEVAVFGEEDVWGSGR